MGGGMKPISEMFGRPPDHPGIAYLFDAIPNVKASYNANRTAFDLFSDADFLAAHGSLPFGPELTRTTDRVWAGTVYPKDRYPTDAAAAGMIFQADFAKFRGRGLIQTTWRQAYKGVIGFVQAYTGSDTVVSGYASQWSGQNAETVASKSTNAQWDELFQQSNYIVPCAAVHLHSASKNNYLDLATDETTLTGSGQGSLWSMGKKISGGDSYATTFKNRVVQMRTALGGG
jgi:hypothetical protein